jgi:uncharacterized protein (DUF983 family)
MLSIIESGQVVSCPRLSLRMYRGLLKSRDISIKCSSAQVSYHPESIRIMCKVRCIGDIYILESTALGTHSNGILSMWLQLSFHLLLQNSNPD